MAHAESGGGGTANLITSLIGASESLLGGTTKGKSKSQATSLTTSTQESLTSGTEQLILDPAAITRIIEEVLSGPEGLASIFAGENIAGIFNSTVAAQAAGNLTAKLVGELAKLTGETVTGGTAVTTAEQLVEQQQQSQTETTEKGLIKRLGDIVGL